MKVATYLMMEIISWFWVACGVQKISLVKSMIEFVKLKKNITLAQR